MNKPLITPETLIMQKCTDVLFQIKQLMPTGIISLVVRFDSENPAVPGNVLFLSEETDTTPLHNAIERAAQAQNDRKRKMQELAQAAMGEGGN